jgi:hypothetical protein
MRTETTGIVFRGCLLLDHPIELPDQSRVHVAVEPERDWRIGFNVGLLALRKLCEERPIHAGGRRYTRDELHERR